MKWAEKDAGPFLVWFFYDDTIKNKGCTVTRECPKEATHLGLWAKTKSRPGFPFTTLNVLY